MKRLMIAIALVFVFSEGRAADGSKVKTKASETAEAVGDYAVENKDDFKKQMSEDLAEVQAQMERLKKRAEAASGAAQDSIKRQMTDLESKRVVLKKKLDETAQSSGEAWTQVKSGMKKAMDEIKEGFKKVRATISDEPESSKN